jgi:hypothetical protein
MGPSSGCPMQVLGLSEARVGLSEAPFGARAMVCFAVAVVQVSQNTASGILCPTRQVQWASDPHRPMQNTLEMTKGGPSVGLILYSCWAYPRHELVFRGRRGVSPRQARACPRHPLRPELSVVCICNGPGFSEHRVGGTMPKKAATVGV